MTLTVCPHCGSTLPRAWWYRGRELYWRNRLWFWAGRDEHWRHTIVVPFGVGALVIPYRHGAAISEDPCDIASAAWRSP